MAGVHRVHPSSRPMSAVLISAAGVRGVISSSVGALSDMSSARLAGRALSAASQPRRRSVPPAGRFPGYGGRRRPASNSMLSADPMADRSTRSVTPFEAFDPLSDTVRGARPSLSGSATPLPDRSRPLPVVPGRSWRFLTAPGRSWPLLAELRSPPGPARQLDLSPRSEAFCIVLNRQAYAYVCKPMHAK